MLPGRSTSTGYKARLRAGPAPGRCGACSTTGRRRLAGAASLVRRAAAGPPREVEGDAGGLGEAAEGDRLTAAEHLPKALLGPERRCRALVGGGLTQGCRGYLASRWLPASSAAMTSVRADTPAPQTARAPPPSAGATVSRVAMTRPRASCSWRRPDSHTLSSPSCWPVRAANAWRRSSMSAWVRACWVFSSGRKVASVVEVVWVDVEFAGVGGGHPVVTAGR